MTKERTRMVSLIAHPLNARQVASLSSNFGENGEFTLSEPVIAGEVDTLVDPNADANDVIAQAKSLAQYCADKSANYVIVGGEPTLTYHLVRELIALGITPMVATTKRISQDIPQSDGSTKKISTFQHCGWRRFEV